MSYADIEVGRGYRLGNLRIISLSLNAKLRRNSRSYHAPQGEAWCSGCVSYHSVEMFYSNPQRVNGFANYCKDCMRRRRGHS